MEKPKRSSFPSGRQGSTKYAAAMKAWRAKQPKRWRPLSALDKDRTASEKERAARNPQLRKTIGKGRSKKTKIVPNPKYREKDASGTKKHEVDMESIKKIVAKQKGGSKEKTKEVDKTYGTGMPSNYKGGHSGGGKKSDDFNKNKEGQQSEDCQP